MKTSKVVTFVLLGAFVISISLILSKYFLIPKFSFLMNSNPNIVIYKGGNIILNSKDIKASDVTAFDIKIDYDKNNLEIKSAKLGSNYENNTKLFWNLENGHFASFSIPQDTLNRNESNILLSLDFDKEVEDGDISIKPESIIYIKNKGEVYLNK